MMLEEVGNDHIPIFINSTTISRVEVGADGKLYRLSISSGKEYLSKDKLYTKANMIAMLTEIQSEIEELEKPFCHYATRANGCVDKGRVEGVIQGKIDSLKENKE